MKLTLSKVPRPHWWFAWRPVIAHDVETSNDVIVWLEKVYCKPIPGYEYTNWFYYTEEP